MSPAAGARRSNEDWVRALRGAGPDAQRAQEELRALVRSGLRQAVSVLDESTLDDLAQIAVMRIVEKLDRFEGRSRFTTWAYSVALRAALTELRKAAPERAHLNLDETQVTDARSGPTDASGPAERAEIVEVLYRVIDERLTPKQRRAVLGELRGTSTLDLAEELGTNQNALYKLLHDARGKLRDGLETAGISDDEVREAFEL